MSDNADRAGDQDEVIMRAAIANAGNSKEYGDSMGICLGCGDPIPEKRLAAMPGCTYCVECQEERARGWL